MSRKIYDDVTEALEVIRTQGIFHVVEPGEQREDVLAEFQPNIMATVDVIRELAEDGVISNYDGYWWDVEPDWSLFGILT